MKYILPENLIDDLNVINNSTSMFAIPYGVDNEDIIVIDVPADWGVHNQFVLDNSLIEYVDKVTILL